MASYGDLAWAAGQGIYHGAATGAKVIGIGNAIFGGNKRLGQSLAELSTDPNVNKRMVIQRRVQSGRGYKSLKKRKIQHKKRMAWVHGVGSNWGPLQRRLECESKNYSVTNNVCSYNYDYYPEKSDLLLLMDNYQGDTIVWDSSATAGNESVPKRIEHGYDATLRPYSHARLAILPSSYKEYTFRNNNLVSVRLGVYEYICIDDTTRSILSLMDDSAEKLYGSAVSTESEIMLTPTMLQTCIKDRYALLKNAEVILAPGETTVYRMYIRTHDVYNTFNDEKSNTATRLAGMTKCLQVRLEGCLGHSQTTGTNVAYLAGDVDVGVKSYINYKIGGMGPKTHISEYTNLPTIAAGDEEQAQKDDPAHESTEL